MHQPRHALVKTPSRVQQRVNAWQETRRREKGGQAEEPSTARALNEQSRFCEAVTLKTTKHSSRPGAGSGKKKGGKKGGDGRKFLWGNFKILSPRPVRYLLRYSQQRRERKRCILRCIKKFHEMTPHSAARLTASSTTRGAQPPSTSVRRPALRRRRPPPPAVR